MLNILQLGRRIFCVFGFFLLLSCLSCEKELQSAKNIFTQEQDQGVIVVVNDGDTMVVEFRDGQRKKIRLLGIDSPEMNHPDEQVRLLAELSKRFAFYYLYRKQVTLMYDWEREDTYGRILAYLWTEENGMFNEFIIKEGFASAYLRFPFKAKYRKLFVQAEQSARSSNKGLWRKEPYPAVPLDSIGNHIGQTAAVQYTCREVETKGQFIFLSSEEQIFSTLIPNNSRKRFDDIKAFKGRVIRVEGFVEEYNGQPQILAFFPRQIKVDGIDKNISIKREKLL